MCSEFGEEDVDKVKSAVRMFVHSCAGYSVATYVLVSAGQPDIARANDSLTAG